MITIRTVRGGLVGRRSDLDLIVGVLSDEAPAARAVEIVGDPGIGKTALLDALRERFVVRTAATAVEQTLTWAGLAQLVDDWPAADLSGLSSTLRRALDGALGRDEASEPGLVAAAVAALVEAATARGPAVVAVDDAHWIDDATAGVIAYAVRANRHRPVRLLCARRPVPSSLQPERLVEPAAFHGVVLAGLSVAGVHDLLATTGIQVNRPQLVQIHEATGGNPLHVIELARLIAAGAPLAEAVRETTLESVMGRRVRSLSPSSLTVLGAAALTATPTFDVLTGCFDQDVVVSDALVEAERAGLVTMVESTVRFVHPTVGGAAAAALGTIARRHLHRRLAEVVGADERPLHLDASTDGPDEAVAAALDAAARDAWERGAPEVASRRMTRSIERTPPAAIATRWERRIALADMLLDVGAVHDAVAAVATDAEPAADDQVLAARVVRSRAVCHFHAAEEITAVEEFAAVAAMFPPGHPTRVDALLAQARTTLFFDVAASVAVASQAAAEAPATGDERLIDTTAACELSSRFLSGEPVSVPESGVSNSRRMNASELLDEVLLWNDELDRAEPGILERIADAEHRGDLVALANISIHAAEARMRRGDPRGARARYESVLELSSTMDDRAWIATSRASLASVCAYLGDTEPVRGHLEAARAVSADLSRGDRLAVHSSAGIAALLIGDASYAVEHFRLGRAITLDLGLHDCNALPFRAHMVEALLAVGEGVEACEVADELERFARRAGRTRGIGDAHRAAALLAAHHGDLDAARCRIEAAIAEHDRLHGPLEGAWSRLIAGVIERRARRRAAARAYFEQARDACRPAGAEALAQRADAELARTEGRTTRIDELTPAEEQVARLVALGHTNTEVAALLRMSPKTVEANLTRIYRKLGVRSRTELAARAPA